MQPGDVVGLNDGHLYRCEMDGWSDVGKAWVVRVQDSQNVQCIHSRQAYPLRLLRGVQDQGVRHRDHLGDRRKIRPVKCSARLFR
jgi:hypothetical protein